MPDQKTLAERESKEKKAIAHVKFAAREFEPMKGLDDDLTREAWHKISHEALITLKIASTIVQNTKSDLIKAWGGFENENFDPWFWTVDNLQAFADRFTAFAELLRAAKERLLIAGLAYALSPGETTQRPSATMPLPLVERDARKAAPAGGRSKFTAGQERSRVEMNVIAGRDRRSGGLAQLLSDRAAG